MPERGKRRDPKTCLKCNKDCKTSDGVPCNFCEIWSHWECVDGMTQAFIDCSDAMMRMDGKSSYLCMSCRKMTEKISGNNKDMMALIGALQDDLKEEREERRKLAERVMKLEGGAEKVKEKVVVIEKEIESGMEEAVKGMSEALGTEKKEMEEKAVNIVVYGLMESEKENGEERKKEDEVRIKEMLRVMEVEVDEGMEVKWRLGKKSEGTAMRPLVVKMASEEAKERVLREGRKLKRKDEWTKVFVSPDLTYRQRVEARKQEEKLKDEAAKKNEEEKNEEEQEGEWIVVGPRGKRRIVRRRERAARA